jgi:hypothetical protein
VLAGQPDRQVAGSAADLEDPCAGGGDRRDVGGDAPAERAEQAPGQGVVDAGVADEEPPATVCPLPARRPCRRTATATAAAPARIAKFRGRIIKPPLDPRALAEAGNPVFLAGCTRLTRLRRNVSEQPPSTCCG